MKVHMENWLGVGKWETQQATYRLECYSDKTAINRFSFFNQKNWFCSRGLGVQVQIQILSSISSMISSWLLYFSEPESRDIGHRQKRGKSFILYQVPLFPRYFLPLYLNLREEPKTLEDWIQFLCHPFFSFHRRTTGSTLQSTLSAPLGFCWLLKSAARKSWGMQNKDDIWQVLMGFSLAFDIIGNTGQKQSSHKHETLVTN